MFFIMQYVGLLVLIVSGFFTMTGCVSGPVPASQKPESSLPVSTGTMTPRKAPFGTFNVHKRHGLGGWEKPGNE